jgi:hypothetical protein
MDYMAAATKSRDKTAKKYKSDIDKFFQEQSDRFALVYKQFFDIKSDVPFPIDKTDELLDLFFTNYENEILVLATNPMHTSGAQKAVEDINKLSTVATVVGASLSNPSLVVGLQRISQKITRVNASTKLLMKRIILNGIAEGEGVVSIGQMIRTAGLNEYYEGRALAVARTETRIAYDLGGKVSYTELGIGEFDVVGCTGTLSGATKDGLTASYGDYSEPIGACGILNAPMRLWDAVSNEHHPNHNGAMVSSEQL